MRKRILIALLSLSVFGYTTGVSSTQSLLYNPDYTYENTLNVGPQANVEAEDQPDENAQIQSSGDLPTARTVARTYTAIASWYRHGRVTANGEPFNPHGLTVAHKSLPFNTVVRLTNPETGAVVTARVNDRGPYIKGREFDVSLGCAQLLGIKQTGVTTLIIEILM